MKKLLAFCLAAFTITACVNDRKDNNGTIEVNADSTATKPDTIADMPWRAELDTITQIFSLKRNELIKTSDLDTNNVIKVINKTYPENPIIWNYKVKDTAYVSIPNAVYLTQQSGSLGAKIYLAESTYCITEIPGINVVKFDFTVGDHATPGAYSRSDFNFSMP